MQVTYTDLVYFVGIWVHQLSGLCVFLVEVDNYCIYSAFVCVTYFEILASYYC